MKKNKFEDSPQDEREDRAMAKKLGMSKAKWERTDANKKHDAEGQKKMSKKMAMGGPAGRENEMGGMRPGNPMSRMPERPAAPMTGQMRPGMAGAAMGAPAPAAMAPRPAYAGPDMARKAQPMTAMKKGGAVKKMAKGGAVRGSGCACRGVKKAKSY